MKILITNFHPGDGGGHTTYITSLINDKSKSVKFSVACPRSSRLFAEANMAPSVAVFAIEFPGKLKELLNVLIQLKRLRSLLLQEAFDIVHINGSPDHRLVMLVRLLIPSDKRPAIVFTKHNCFSFSTSGLTLYRFRHHCDAIILVCNALKSLITKDIPSNKTVCVVENGVDVNFFKPYSLERKLELRREMGIPANQLVFASCAGTGSHKGWQDLAKTVSDNPSITVILIGPRPKDDYLLEVFDADCPGNIIFTGYQQDVRPYLAVANVGFVLSTSIETASFACREMMSMGLPVLVSDLGCLPENVTGGSGWVVKAGSRAAIDEIIPVIQEADLGKMSLAARNRVVKTYQVQDFRSRTIAVYEEVINGATF